MINKDYNLTQYVTTKYYRAPELFFQYRQNYTSKVDMWSLGCIIAELFNGKVLFKASQSIDYINFCV